MAQPIFRISKVRWYMEPVMTSIRHLPSIACEPFTVAWQQQANG